MRVAPFSWLAQRYEADLAVLWIDSHPDAGTPASQYAGYHAMAVAVLTGHGDPAALPATVDPSRVALVGLHAWTDDDFPNAARKLAPPALSPSEKEQEPPRGRYGIEARRDAFSTR